MSEQTFLLPDLGEGLAEAEIVRWLVAEGDVVAVDQPVVEVETAKAAVEVPTPHAGRVAALHGATGDVVSVGKPLVTVVALDGETYREEERAGSGNVLIGFGTSGGETSGRRRRPRTPARTTRAGDAGGAVPLVASPLVRRLARDLGVDVAAVRGTGPDGLVTRADVERARGAVADVPPTAAGGERRTPLSAFRKAAAAALSRSRTEIPEATVWVDVDATELWELRRSAPEGPGLIAYLARFTVAALRQYPVLNARLDTEREEIVELDRIGLGIAVQTDRGLLVPAVVGAETMTTNRLDEEIRQVTTRAREGKATAAELAAGTFTLNNYGSFRVDGSAAIIPYPQVALLGIGRVLARPWVVDGELCARMVTQLSLVFDHRVCDGGTAAGFLRSVADAIENPAGAIATL